MPEMKCKAKGKTGKKYGEGGKCYTGSDKEAKVKAQRAAINISKARRAGHKIPKKGK